jgi:hypothetical protein
MVAKDGGDILHVAHVRDVEPFTSAARLQDRGTELDWVLRARWEAPPDGRVGRRSPPLRSMVMTKARDQERPKAVDLQVPAESIQEL